MVCCTAMDRRSLYPVMKSETRAARELAAHGPHGVLDLLFARLPQMRRDGPVMAEWILDDAVTVAPEHVGDRHLHRRTRLDGVLDERVDIRHVEMDRHRSPVQRFRR